MRKLLFILILFSVMKGFGQKKLQPVRSSELTGINLPEGSSRDKRMLSVVSARILLEMESKKDGSAINDVEILYLPPESSSKYGADSLVAAFTQTGWAMSPVERDNKYLWLQKDAKAIMVYFQTDPKQTQLYFGVAATPPSFNGGSYTPTPPVSNPPVSDPNPPPVPPSPPQNNYTPPPPPVTQIPMNMEQTGATPSGSNGIIISTINFDDGWVSMPMENWVQATKGEFKVLMHYASPLPENLRSEDYNVILNYYWNLLVQPRYSFSNVEIRKDNTYSYKREYFMEADAVESITGRTCHVCFRIYMENGIATCVEIQSSSKSSYYSAFPTLESIDPLKGYNKFAVSQADIVGEWEESSGSFANYYNVYTGGYAGMNAVSNSSKVLFSPNGQFNIEHKGASGMVGSQQFYSEKHAGSYQVSNWEIAMVETDGKQVGYYAYYEAVKNGRILHLQNKQYSGSQMHLIKSK